MKGKKNTVMKVLVSKFILYNQTEEAVNTD